MRLPAVMEPSTSTVKNSSTSTSAEPKKFRVRVLSKINFYYVLVRQQLWHNKHKDALNTFALI